MTTKPPDNSSVSHPGETGETTNENLQELLEKFGNIQNKLDELKVTLYSILSLSLNYRKNPKKHTCDLSRSGIKLPIMSLPTRQQKSRYL